MVLKIVPMEGDALVNGEPQKRAGEIAAEVTIALALSDLRGAGARPMFPSHTKRPSYISDVPKTPEVSPSIQPLI